VNSRRGTSSLGCLFSLLVAAAAIYVGVNVAQVYWRFYQYQDDMRQLVNYDTRRPDDKLIATLRANADSLDLPDAARQISIRRSETMISIEADYYEHVELPMYSRDIHFHPYAEGPL